MDKLLIMAFSDFVKGPLPRGDGTNGNQNLSLRDKQSQSSTVPGKSILTYFTCVFAKKMYYFLIILLTESYSF